MIVGMTTTMMMAISVDVDDVKVFHFFFVSIAIPSIPQKPCYVLVCIRKVIFLFVAKIRFIAGNSTTN